MKYAVIIFIFIGVISFTLIILNKKQTEPTTGKMAGKKVKVITDNDIYIALKAIKTGYGLAIAQNVEKIFRNETRHFKSQQFLNSYSAGMEKHDLVYPFGWKTMKPLWDKHPTLAPIGFYTIKENNSAIGGSKGDKTFLVFPDLIASMASLAEYLKVYPAGRWGGTTAEIMNKYQSILNTITPKIVNSLT